MGRRKNVVRSKSQGSFDEKSNESQDTSETKTVYYRNGDTYLGNLSGTEQKRHGTGIYIFRNGDKYSGNWQRNVFHGYGCFQWLIGDCFEGQWINGHHHGYGVKCMHDGSIVKGYACIQLNLNAL
jgi:hypothetical protein